MASRGTTLHPPNRFARIHAVPDPAATDADDPDAALNPSPEPRTQFFIDATESILSENDSPDVGFRWGINPYRGCEHGCAYCYARTYHEYLGFDAGLEFETRIMVKTRAPALLRKALAAPRWHPAPIALSGATDCYQPAEKHFRLTRGCLEVLAEARNPALIITKNFLVTRDRDVLGTMAAWGGVGVCVTITTLDSDLAGRLEPRAARPEHRLRAIRMLAEAGVPVGVMVAPVIPGLTDHEMPAILAAAAAAGARRANYVALRLPLTVKDVFLDWLSRHEPGKRDRVISRLEELHGGRLYEADFATRMRGQGIFAEQMRQLFHVTTRRLGYASDRLSLETGLFRRPAEPGQLDLGL